MSKMIVKTYKELYGKDLTIRDLVNGFEEDTKTGKVVAFDGNLNIRPPYQREFIYELDKQKAVVDTVLKGYPLNVMYWAKNGDGFEVMDGQQRIMSICKFYKEAFSITVEVANKQVNRTFSELESKMEDFLNYPLTIYVCDGDDDMKMAWFQIINIAGVKLTDQEMRNAIYNGSWVNDAKKYFSRVQGEGYASEGHVTNGHTYGDYVKVTGGTKSEKEDSVVRQKLLEIVLGWAVDKHNRENPDNKYDINKYMEECKRSKTDAKELWRYYEDVMEWVKNTFPTYREIMKDVKWGELYNQYKDKDKTGLDKKVNDLFAIEEEISNISKAYEAVLSGKTNLLNARAFDKKKFAADFKRIYEDQKHMCPYCHKEFALDEMEADHIKPWSKGGTTTTDNLQLLCKGCNIKKSNYDETYSLWDDKQYEEFNLEKWDEEMNKESQQ